MRKVGAIGWTRSPPTRKGASTRPRELAASFAQWLDDTYQNRERLPFADTTFSILLDGELFARLRPEWYALLKLLAVHKTSGAYVTADEIICAFNDLAEDKSSGLACVRDFPSGPTGLKRLARAVGYLPDTIQRLIIGQPGRGRFFCLEPE